MCEPHHKIKHKGGWTLRANPTTQATTWTSPTGHTYNVEPEDHRSTAAECPF